MRFSRFLAKIAHAYARARVFDGECPPFQPYLRKYILNKTPLLGATLVGNRFNQDINTKDPRHLTLAFVIPASGRRYLAVDIRIFGTITAWRYTVIVGRVL
jgi:hypothetical protein